MTISAPPTASTTGFGFDHIMGNPDRARFATWYAQSSRLAPARGTAAVHAAPVAKSGFGFDDIMRHPDWTRFPSWYGAFSCLAPGRDADATAAGIDPAALAEAA